MGGAGQRAYPDPPCHVCRSGHDMHNSNTGRASPTPNSGWASAGRAYFAIPMDNKWVGKAVDGTKRGQGTGNLIVYENVKLVVRIGLRSSHPNGIGSLCALTRKSHPTLIIH